MAHAGATLTTPAGKGRGPAAPRGGRVRLKGLLDADLCEALRAAPAEWRGESGPGRRYEVAPLAAELAARVRAAFAEAGLAAPAELRLMRHATGDHGLPPGAVLVLDLEPAWRSADGGLLLFPEGDDRAVGWRPEAGAVTLFDADAPPVLSLVAPCAPNPRRALVGLAE